MKSRLYACPRYRKIVNSTSGLTRYVNICKIPITLPNGQASKPTVILEDNTTNWLDLPSNNNEENISPRASNHKEQGIKPTDNNDKDIRSANIDQQRLTTPN